MLHLCGGWLATATYLLQLHRSTVCGGDFGWIIQSRSLHPEMLHTEVSYPRFHDNIIRPELLSIYNY